MYKRQAENRAYRKIINSWSMYDWANSAFATTIMAAMFPPFYRSLAIAAGLSEPDATAAWAYTTAFGLALAAVMAPILGAISDHTGGKKRYIAFFVALGVVATALFVILGDDNYLLASVLFLSLIHISEPTRLLSISYAVFCLKKKKKRQTI